MTFPCLVCGDLPIVDQPVPQPSTGASTTTKGNSSTYASPAATASSLPATSGIKKTGGATIRTLSKDVSDKIFRNLCRQLLVKPEPYWFIQNPGEQAPFCAFCSGVVLEIYTLQTKVDQFQAMIKKLVWKLERIVADTEIAGNWMATREEQEGEEEMWNTIPCPPMAIRIARERHHKFRNQILQNFKTKVKHWRRMRAAGQQADEMQEMEPTFANTMEPTYENGDKENQASSSSANHSAPKRSRLDDTVHPQNMPALIRAQRIQSPISVRSSPSALSGPSHGVTVTSFSKLNQPSASNSPIKIPSTISVSAVGPPKLGERNQDQEIEYGDDDEMEEEQQIFHPDVQIVADYLKEEPDYSGDDSTLEQDGNYWNATDDNMDDQVEAMSIAEGEDVVYLAPGLALRKFFINQLLTENLKPSVFLRKLVFAVFGIKQVANSSGICGSNKAGAKPSLDRYKFEALREYTIETYGIRDNLVELEDLNRKIRTICCDARKALKRKTLKTSVVSSQNNTNNSMDRVSVTASTSTAVATSILHHVPDNIPPPSMVNLPDLFHLATGSLNSGVDDEAAREITDEDDDDHQLPHMPVSVTLDEEGSDEIHS